MASDITTEALVHTADATAAAAEALTAEIIALCPMVDAARDSEKAAWLAGAYSALMWARAPNGFAPPSESRFRAEHD